jgi:protein-S-isoprenylcysteine O-methyltransferase Ste14
MNQMFFHIVFVVVFTSFTIIRMIYHRKASQTRGKVEYKEGRLNLALRLIFGIPFILLLFVYMFNPGILSWAQFTLPEWAQWLGVVLGIASIPLIWWVQWALGSNFATTLHVREEHTLVTHGPYRWVRHPMYTVLYILEVAILLLTANWFLGGVLLIGQTVVIVNRINNEEKVMIEKFGDEYRAYIHRTGRFLPRRLIGGLR